jgi:hypothetical protein
MTDSIVYPSAKGLWDEASASLGEPDVALEEAIDARMAFLKEWLEEHAVSSREELASLDGVTREQIFWHHGYLVALRSVQSFIGRRRHALH